MARMKRITILDSDTGSKLYQATLAEDTTFELMLRNYPRKLVNLEIEWYDSEQRVAPSSRTYPAFIDGCGTLVLGVHEIEGGCEGGHCMIHNPSDHSLKDCTLQWREEHATGRHMFFRVCEHGIRHPDPDGVEYARDRGWLGPREVNNHSCDGCCTGAYG